MAGSSPAMTSCRMLRRESSRLLRLDRRRYLFRRCGRQCRLSTRLLRAVIRFRRFGRRRSRTRTAGLRLRWTVGIAGRHTGGTALWCAGLRHCGLRDLRLRGGRLLPVRKPHHRDTAHHESGHDDRNAERHVSRSQAFLMCGPRPHPQFLSQGPTAWRQSSSAGVAQSMTMVNDF